MIDLFHSFGHTCAYPYVCAALKRAVSSTQVREVRNNAQPNLLSRILIIINPEDYHIKLVKDWKNLGPGKLILLGKLSLEFVGFLNLQLCKNPKDRGQWSDSNPAPLHGFSESIGQIRYTENSLPLTKNIWCRPLERFDFLNEWNNLGYGAIRREDPPWSLSLTALAPEYNSLANLEIDNETIATYCYLRDEANTSILWYNREAGPIDSFEWRLVENFLSTWRFGELPCQPILSEIPWGYDSAVTMRLDCDENIETSRPLRVAYQNLNVPFSLAINTSILKNKNQHSLIKDMVKANECILSHTATHAPNWGGSYERAIAEANESICLLKQITGKQIKYAVSPFHHSPPYALKALADAGLSGCIGGIIGSNPEFLLARGGVIPDIRQEFVGHSQQRMLHGDCLLDESDPLRIYKQSFQIAYQTRTLFGYLDHPFSDRYQYGWSSESSRINAHEELIFTIRNTAEQVVFLSEDSAMDFLLEKSKIKIVDKDGYFFLEHGNAENNTRTLTPSLEYGGKFYPAKVGFVK